MKVTKRDLETLEAIKTYIDDHGYAPSYREVADLVGLKSTSTIFVRITRLYTLRLIETDLPERTPRAFRVAKEKNNVEK